ncbi:helix-turn-helix domain-containing protein [Rhizobium leguminosarum bv. viciae]|uniref:Helix-turn-helix domain-containing protein n=1 Tax=Rhizobium leguminosarum bv. viciae TaxID=387 RepID=A0A8I2H4M3_RHILV|nr:AraC family transcriptional regulator [Rhizobium leguminosarum]MBY5750233.1 helix-turn-helix transcriptional regulator [Rhizobium leguminosarum]MBY5786016.1 helix-turn-helix transcriptional regulator [Rhizobium leguminosarum]MBY5821944.1 helix-turn-helix transcriptional regulator [Rhizobium leguminosarum]NKM49433.1 helix-turn-helix domain-containing protein [Rhizobium leguminosarum bv. viciae]TBY71562.1 AraC family transcriptional regulator [Rhizobium leguminosarum bv. viciae]
MTFQPRMQNKIQGFSVIGGVHRRLWNGIVADVWDVECASYAGGYYVSRDPRLFIMLDKRGPGNSRIKLSPKAQGAIQDTEKRPISYVPAGMEVWADLTDVHSVRHLDLHFDADTISRRLMEDIDPRRLESPQLLFSDERVLSLAQLVAAECLNPEPLHDLYGDGLALALIIDVLKLSKAVPRKRSKLAGWQLRRATDFIEENCLRNIRLEELAGLTGLSQSHFSHAFKASTGIAPHQWQTNARLDRAKRLLVESENALTAIAAETGFADQAHFTRVFRKHVGITPASWKKAQVA